MQSPLPSWLPFGDGEALPGYQYIKGGFKLSTLLYYNGVHSSGEEHVPPPGSPALLCFNHSNGLVDAMMIVRSCPRMVRFMAKDTLWKIPGIGFLVSGAGAVQVQRREEHGADADTTASLAAVLEALRRGCCVGVAPEGNSKMRTGLDLPLKKGVGHLAVEAALVRLSEGFADASVRVVPCGLSFPQREKWRSEALAAYGKPIVVDRDFLGRHGLAEMSVEEAKKKPQYKAAVGEIMERLAAALSSLTFSLPAPNPPADEAQALEGDWSALATGVIAARIVRSGGTEVSLQEWLGAVKGYAKELASGQRDALVQSLRGYQKALDHTGLMDSQICALQAALGIPAGSCGLLLGLLGHYLLGFVLLVLALPGLIPWSPILLLCLMKEARIIKQGLLQSQPGSSGPNGVAAKLPGPARRRRNFDTLAQDKMLIGWLLSYLLRLGCCVLLHWLGLSWWMCLVGGFAALPLAMWLDVRLLEEGFASFRAGAACWALLKASADTLDALARQRDQLRSELKPLAVQADALGAPPADWRPRHFFLPWRRWKADWLESMLFQEDLSFMGVHDQAVAPRSSGPGDAVAGTSPATPLLS